MSASNRTLVVVLALSLPAPAAHAYSLRHAPDGAPVRWARPTIELRVDPALAGDAERSQAIVSAAAAAWRSGEHAPEIVVTGPTAHPPGFDVRGGENGVYVVRGEWRHGTALAVTVTTKREGDGELLDADVLLQARGDLSTDEGPREGAYDLRSLVTHELGHLLGLGESDVREATMFPRLARGDVGPRTLHADDEEGLAALYAPVTRAAAYGCAAGFGARASLPWLSVLGIGLALTLARLRRRRTAAIAAAAAVSASLALASGFCVSDASAPLGAAALDLARAERARIVGTELVEADGVWTTLAFSDAGDVLEVPGGRRGDLVQTVGDVEPPRTGDTLVVAPDGVWAYAGTTHAWGGALAASAPIPLPERLRSR